jgi:DNA-directed RNA polymerase subunit M/transcription elongation factor TFIIS
MEINTALPFTIILPVLIVFAIDPNTSLVADTYYKQNYREIAASEDKFNKGKASNQIQSERHLCPRCESHSLSFEGLNIDKGKQIQLINCKVCDYEWQEIWKLPNWHWLKSSFPEDHWTSGRWNSG